MDRYIFPAIFEPGERKGYNKFYRFTWMYIITRDEDRKKLSLHLTDQLKKRQH